MSRAFAPGESEDDGERFVVKAAVLPPGAPNYITPDGMKRLERERDRLTTEKAALDETVEAKQRGKAIDQQLAFLADRLNGATVIDPVQQPKDCVAFGAMVSVKAEGLGTQTWRIVGVDEVDLKKGWISWISPLAKALLDKRAGDAATLGNQRFTLLSISYPVNASE